MARGKPKRSQSRRRFRPLDDCSFCKGKFQPDYKEADKLARFITDRGEIAPRGRIGTCAKHQRRVATEIKKARYLALLPFLTRVKK